jgi:hypothetical protein
MQHEQTKHINPYKVFYQITSSFSSYEKPSGQYLGLIVMSHFLGEV